MNVDIRIQAQIMIRDQMEKYMAERACTTCKGYRLSKKSLAVKVEGRHIGEVTELSIEKALAFFNNVDLIRKRNANCQIDST